MNQVVAMAARGGDRLDAQLEDSLYHLFCPQSQDSACCSHVHVANNESTGSLLADVNNMSHELSKMSDVSGGRILARFCLHFSKGVFVAVGMYLGERLLR